jgi:small subunit ribosomal protein S20
MANTKSAVKRIRTSAEQRLRNRGYRSRMRTAVKRLREAVAAGNADEAQRLLPDTLSLVDATAQKSAIHQNAAARTKSRLVKAVSGLQG